MQLYFHSFVRCFACSCFNIIIISYVCLIIYQPDWAVPLSRPIVDFFVRFLFFHHFATTFQFAQLKPQTKKKTIWVPVILVSFVKSKIWNKTPKPIKFNFFDNNCTNNIGKRYKYQIKVVNHNPNKISKIANKLVYETIRALLQYSGFVIDFPAIAHSSALPIVHTSSLWSLKPSGRKCRNLWKGRRFLFPIRIWLIRWGNQQQQQQQQ